VPKKEGWIGGRGRLLGGKLPQCTAGTTYTHNHTHTSASSGGGAQKLSGASARDLSCAKAPPMVLRGRRSMAAVVVTLGAALPVLPPLPPLVTAAAFFLLAIVLCSVLLGVGLGPVEWSGWACGIRYYAVGHACQRPSS